MNLILRATGLFVFFCVATLGSSQSVLGQSSKKQTGTVLDVLNQPVNNRATYDLVLKLGSDLLEQPEVTGFEELKRQLANRGNPAKIGMPAVVAGKADSLYETMVRSSLIIGVVYDCGRCEKLHVSCAGGVVVGQDGLVLTNHHVIEQEGRTGTQGLVAVSSEGVAYPIAEVLSSSEEDDIALIRLGGDTSRLHPAAIASEQPDPMSPVFVLSHPHRHFFVLTDGKVSRYVYDARPVRKKTVWMEITAEFGAGSSGSGIFDSEGQVIGLVSTVVPLVRKAGQRKISRDNTPASKTAKKPDLLEVILHRCVPVQAIQKRFGK